MSDWSFLFLILAGLFVWYHASEAHRRIDKLEERLGDAKKEDRDLANIARPTREQRLRDLSAVAESLEYEQRLRNDVAAAHGWPIHPNDVEDLTPEQQREAFDAFRLRQPAPEFVIAALRGR